MPIYEFSCHSCGHEFEQIVSFSATTAPACPACASTEVGRHMSRPAIHFKGSGWYITDSRKGDGKRTNNGASATARSESGDSAGDSTGDSTDSAKATATDTGETSPKSVPEKAAAD